MITTFSGRGGAEGDLRRREVLRAPVPAAVAGLADVPFLGEEGEEVVRGTGSEDLARLERQLERGAPQVGQQDVQVVRVEARLLGRALQQELRVVDDVLVDRRARGDQDADARLLAAPRSAELLPRPGDRARIAREDGDVEGADVDAELERVGARRRRGSRRPAARARSIVARSGGSRRDSRGSVTAVRGVPAATRAGRSG